METFAFLIGTFSLILSVIAIVIMFIMRKNVVDILKRDALIFSKNFEIKKSAFDKAMFILDEIQAGALRSNSVEYNRKMNQIYNELLCVATDGRIADCFISMTKDTSKQLTPTDFANFKLLCRKDLGFDVKHSSLSTQAKTKETNQ